MSTRYRANFYSGLINVTTTTGTTFSGTGFPNLSIPPGEYMAITVAPGYYGTSVTPEIMYIGPTTTSGTVQVLQRGAEGSVAITGTNLPWVAGALVSDYDVTNLTSTGTLTLNNGLNVSNGSYFTGSFTVNNAASFASSTTFLGTAVIAGGIALENSSSLYGIPNGRMYANGSTTISGNASTTSGYAVVQTTNASPYGWANNGVTFSGTRLYVPIAGYYQISASIGFSSSSTADPIVAGVYGTQIGIYNASSVNTGYYVGANNYLSNTSVPGAVPETVSFTDIVYLGAGYSVNLIGYNDASSSTVVLAGAAAGPQTTYLSLSYVSS